jgi:hypothetical protein
MAEFDSGRGARWLHHRLTLIVHAEALEAAREALRCSFFDARLYWRRPQEQALGVPTAKWALSGEFQGQLGSATRLVQCLALHLQVLPVVLLRLETLGSASTHNPPATFWGDDGAVDASSPRPVSPLPDRKVHAFAGALK